MRNKLKNVVVPTHEEIQRRAYELWERAGREPGVDLEYWLRAEAELLSVSRSNGHGPTVHRRNRREAMPFGVEGTRRPVL